MKRVKLLRARTGTYTDRNTGQEKTSYATIGSVLEKDTGERMYKFDTVPVSFDGWVYESDIPQVQPDHQDQKASAPQPRQKAAQDSFDDDIPF